jgi:WD40 repeat protein
LRSFPAHDAEVRTLTFTPDSQNLVTGSTDGFLKVWSVPAGKLVKTLGNLYSAVNAVVVTPNGGLLVSGSGFLKGDLKLWPLPRGESVKNLPGHERSVTTLALSEDGTLLASAGGGKVRLWSLPEGQLLKAVDHEGPVNDLVFLSGGKLLACASDDKNIRLWSVPDGKPQSPLKAPTTGRNGKILALAKLPGEEQSLVSADEEGNLLIWDVGTRKSKPLPK